MLVFDEECQSDPLVPYGSVANFECFAKTILNKTFLSTSAVPRSYIDVQPFCVLTNGGSWDRVSRVRLETINSRTHHRVFRIDRGQMSFIFLIILTAVAHADPGPCTTPRSQAAFLKGVVDGLPESLQSELCLDSSDMMTVSPDETGVSHFVLPGFVRKALLGEVDEGWKLVTHEEPYTQSPDAEAAVMHLWLRAVCIGYGYPCFLPFPVSPSLAYAVIP